MKHGYDVIIHFLPFLAFSPITDLQAGRSLLVDCPRLYIQYLQWTEDTLRYGGKRPTSRDMSGSCEHGGEPSGSIKGWKFPEFAKRLSFLRTLCP